LSYITYSVSAYLDIQNNTTTFLTTKGILATLNIDTGEVNTKKISINLDLKNYQAQKLTAMSKESIFNAQDAKIIRYVIGSKKSKEYTFDKITNLTDITYLKFSSDYKAILIGDLNGTLVVMNFATKKIKLVTKLKDEIYSITSIGDLFLITTLSNHHAYSELCVYNYVLDSILFTIDLKGISIPTSVTMSKNSIFLLNSNHNDLKYTSLSLDKKSKQKISEYLSPGFNRQIQAATLFLNDKVIVSGGGKTLYVVDIDTNEVILTYVTKYKNVLDVQVTSSRIYIIFVDNIQIIDIYQHEVNYISAIKALEFDEAKSYMLKNKFLLFSRGNQLLEEMWNKTLQEAISLLKSGQKDIADKNVLPYRVFPKKVGEYEKYVKEVKLISQFSLLLQQKNTIKAISLLRANLVLFQSVGIYDNFSNKWFAIFNKTKIALRKIENPRFLDIQKLMGGMYHFNKDINNDLLKDLNTYLILDASIKKQNYSKFIEIYNNKPLLEQIPFYKKFFDNIDPLELMVDI